MEHTPEIDRYAKNPELLFKLLREVIDLLDSEDEKRETAAMEAQLREISKAVEKLEKMGVAVPDAFRAEKTRLAAALGVLSDSKQVLNHLADELSEILKDLNGRIGRNSEISPPKAPRPTRSHSPKTDNKTLRKFILEALKHLGGSAHLNDVLKYMERELDGQLLPGDLEWRTSTKNYAWQNNACWERYEMVQEGLLKGGSPRGIWELSEEFR